MPLLSKSVKEAFESRKASASTGNYLNPGSISEGDKIRLSILGDESVSGWEVWVDGNGGKRLPLRFADEPTRADIKARASECDATVPADATCKQFLAFAVWNYNDSKVQVFQFSQSTLVGGFINALSDEEIEAEPALYDFTVSSTGTGRDKRYAVLPLPGRRRKEDVATEVEKAWEETQDRGFNLQLLLSGGDPFSNSL